MSGFRPDIEGLRAVAVLFVIANHLGWLGGGFVGVDIFFVISGFLITGLLREELERTGRVSFVGFYRRRARRILPAAVCVLLVTNLVAHQLFLANRADQTSGDSLWALGFLANVHFATVGTQYFQADRPPSLVQHYWSLSVEEQFYLLWPLLLLGAALLLSRRRRGIAAGATHWPLAGMVLAVTAVSFGWCVRLSVTEPARAYFATTARAWELGVGAVLAVCAPTLARLPARLRPVLALGGLAALAAAAVLVHGGPGFPAPAAALPVLGAAAVIAAAASGWSVALLTNPASRYVGRVSYSLYLWHWPAVLTCEALVPRDAAVFLPLLACVLFSVTIASYHLVEVPFRTGAVWRVLRARPRLTVLRPRLHTVAATVLALAAVLAYQQRPAPQAMVAAPSVHVVHDAATDPTVAPVTADLAAGITKAVQATSFPRLDPPLDTLGGVNRVEEWKDCLYTAPGNESDCSYGEATADAAHTVMLLGDSEALNWVPGLRAVLEPAGWRLQLLTWGQCPGFEIGVVDMQFSTSFTAKCLTHQRWALGQVQAVRPAMAIITSSEISLPRLASGTTGDAAGTEWEAALEHTLVQLRGVTRPLVLSPSPWVISLPQCAPTGRGPAGCVAIPGSGWELQQRAEEAAAAATGARYVDTHLWLCTAVGLCPSFVGHTPVRWDGSHLTQQYAERLAGQFRELLRLG
jgi:peptidoglycan/LPS O-acetylase OafA/YrhL